MYELESGAPSGARLAELKAFLQSRGLTMEGGADYCVALRSMSGELVASGALDGAVLKYIAVAPEAEGEGAAATVVSNLVTEAWRRGYKHLFLFTKPENERMFRSLGFYTVASTESAVMLEDRRSGVDAFIASLPKPPEEGAVGACVVNCNPFTLGHRHLIETAARECAFVYVFVVSEDGSFFPADARYSLVSGGTADIKNIAVVRSGEYIISRATFPAYFIKDRASAEQVRSDMDIAVFGGRIAPPLRITRRYAGTEPFCQVTRAYNARMKELLPKYGVEFKEIPRKGDISASEVRRLMAAGDLEGIRRLVPENVYEYIARNLG